MISANDNRVGGVVVVEPPRTTAGVLDRVGSLAAALASRRLILFGRFLAESTTIGDGSTEAHDCSDEGLPELALSNSEEILAALGYEAVGFTAADAALAACRAAPARFDVKVGSWDTCTTTSFLSFFLASPLSF
jgi:hypothetical protein